MREQKLEEREKLQTERALLLSEQSVNLDDKEQELNRKQAELEALSKTLHDRTVDFSFREIELDELRASLNKDSALLVAQSKELADNREQFANYKNEVEKRSKDAERLANEAMEKFKAAEERELLTAKREKELTERENEIQANISQLEIQKAELLVREKKTQEDIDATNLKIAAIEKQKEDLETAQKIFAREKQKLETDKVDLDNLRAETDKILAEAKATKAEADEKVRQADEIIKLNEIQKVTIAKLETELESKTKELDALYVPEGLGELYAELLSDVPSNASITKTDSGIINWSNGSIRAKGIGVSPESSNEAHAKALARRAAVVDLQRNLLETVQGVQIDSNTKVENLMLRSDVVTTAVQGTIKGVEIVSENWDEKNKTYIVAGQIRQDKMSTTMSEIRKLMKFSKVPKEPKKKTGDYTGLILDVRHLTVEQQKFFHIVDEKGSLVYGAEYANKATQDKEGLCVYFNKIVLTADEKAKVGNNPLVIKAQRFASNGTDIVIPTSEADKIRTNKIDFRKDCKVIIVRS